jgi:hypothetical protein
MREPATKTPVAHSLLWDMKQDTPHKITPIPRKMSLFIAQ